MDPIPFYKMSGAGNDFIIIDNRQQIVANTNLTDFISNVCRRKMSAGADEPHFNWNPLKSVISAGGSLTPTAVKPKCVATVPDALRVLPI